MKNKTCIVGVLAMLSVALPNINCSKDSGGDGFFIPIIENQWFNQANPHDKFNIQAPDQDSANSSTFSGFEDSLDALDNSIAQYNFSGSFTNHNIQFTYDNNSGTKSGKTFSGTINDASTVMTLHNNDLGNLVLQKP
jgi:hypothetical protein